MQTPASLKLPSSKYKSYEIIISQSETSAPTGTVFHNNTGATMTWARTALGTYTITASNPVFTAGKTVVKISNPSSSLVNYTVKIDSTTQITVTSGTIKFVAAAASLVLGDALIANKLIEIRIYN